MGIGRRTFLRPRGIAAAGPAINERIYVNKKLGYFEKPNDWGFIAVKECAKFKRSIK